MSGRSAAFALGWTQQYMSRRLTGIVPFDVADLEAIAALLGVPVTAFFEAPYAAPAAAHRFTNPRYSTALAQVMALQGLAA